MTTQLELDPKKVPKNTIITSHRVKMTIDAPTRWIVLRIPNRGKVEFKFMGNTRFRVHDTKKGALVFRSDIRILRILKSYKDKRDGQPGKSLEDPPGIPFGRVIYLGQDISNPGKPTSS